MRSLENVKKHFLSLIMLILPIICKVFLNDPISDAQKERKKNRKLGCFPSVPNSDNNVIKQTVHIQLEGKNDRFIIPCAELHHSDARNQIR